jgi:hypothetical protein
MIFRIRGTQNEQEYTDDPVDGVYEIPIVQKHNGPVIIDVINTVTATSYQSIVFERQFFMLRPKDTFKFALTNPPTPV